MTFVSTEVPSPRRSRIWLACIAAATLLVFSFADRAEAGNLYYAGEQSVINKTQNLEGAGAGFIVTGPAGAAGVSGLALDGKHLYWSSTSGTPKGVWQSNLDGTSPTKILTTGTNSTLAVAVNGDDIYWIEGTVNTIGHAVLADGGGIVPGSQKDDLITGLTSGNGLAVLGDKIYWSNGANPGTIGRAILTDNGNSVSNVTQSFVTSLPGPSGVAVDANFVYWANFTGGSGSTLGRASVADGVTGKTNSYVTGGNIPLGVWVDSNYIYWAQFFNANYGRRDISAGAGAGTTFMTPPNVGNFAEMIVSQRASGTSISCSPDPVVTEATTTCTATVVDNDVGVAARPDGVVRFSTDGSGIFGDGTQGEDECTLAPLTIGTSTCSVTYTPFDAGNETIAGDYLGNTRFISTQNQDAITITVPPHPTTTSVDCDPTDPQIDTDTTCTITVTDTADADTTNPTGNVALSSTGGGDFEPDATCALQPAGGVTSQCQVTYTPQTAGPDTVTAEYAGDNSGTPVFGESSGGDDLDVQPLPAHPTTTELACDPASVALAATSTCTVTVSDVAADDRGTPQGDVDFSTGPGGDLSAPSCALGNTGGSKSTCEVQFTPTTAGAHTITANFAGNLDFATSAGQATVTGQGPAGPGGDNKNPPVTPTETGQRAKALKKCKKKKGKKSKKKCKKRAKKKPV